MSSYIQDTTHQDLPRPPQIRQRRVALMLAIGMLVLAGLGYGFTSLSQTFNADKVLTRSSLRLAVVERGDLVREVMAQGRVVVANSPTLFSPEQGYIELKVKAGDSVTEGQLLAVVSSPELLELRAREQAQLARLQADLARQKIESEQSQLQLQQSLAMAKVQLKAMQREKRRADKSFELRLISEFDHEKQIDDLERAELEYHQTAQTLALSKNSMEFYDRSLQLQAESQQMVIQALERRVDELNILSPVNGMVGNIEVNQKQAVAANQPLITVVDLSTYEIEASVAEGLANELAPLMDAKIRLNGEDYLGAVTAISPEVVRGEVTVRIRFAGDLPPSLRQNQRLTARIQLEHRPEVLMVQRGPFFDDFRGFVLTLDGDRADKRPVILGGRSLSHIEIMEGVNEGETVIVSALDISHTDKSILVTR